MRLRVEKKLRKACGKGSAELMEIVSGRKQGHHSRGDAAKSLLQVGDRRGVDLLLEEFFRVEDKMSLLKLALEIEDTDDCCAVGPMVRAMKDKNPHRRYAAARALGWLFGTPERRRGCALTEALADLSQPNLVRETAAEGLAHVTYLRAVPTLIVASRDEVPWVRFWSVYALGSKLWDDRVRAEVIAALEAALEDHVHPGGGYWPIRLEALAMLGTRGVGDYRARMQEELTSGANEAWVDCFWDKEKSLPRERYW